MTQHLRNLRTFLNSASMLEKLHFIGLEFYLKRDDLLGELNGNKARKLSFYLKQNYPKNQRFISYGGSQSNALAALSIFAKNYKFIFVCEKISNFLKQNPCGNYAFALQNNAEILENLHFSSHREMALSLCEKNDIFIEEGIANQNAELGYMELAKELKEHSKELGVKFDIFLPSGIGTSATFLAKHSEFRVFTCACVGGSAYLKKQILKLNSKEDFSNLFILEPPKKYHFAKPYKEFYTLYKALKQECGVEFDLLYDMVGFSTLMHHKDKLKNILYIHQGGTLGNESMLLRYQFKKFN